MRALPMQLVDKPMEQVVDARPVDVSMCALQRENRGRSDCYRRVAVARLEAGVATIVRGVVVRNIAIYP
jgi:hypothetical protein